MCIKYIQRLCQSRLSTADYALFWWLPLQRQSNSSNCLHYIVVAWITQHRKHSSPIVVEECYHSVA
jgi:hypothetical protein